RADNGISARLRDQQEIAGINRHAEMLDAPADRLNCGGDHIAPVGDGRGSEHDDEFSARAEHLLHGARERALLVWYAPFGDDRGRGWRQAFLRHFQGLVDHLAGESRQHGRNHTDLANAIRGNAHQRARRLGDGKRRIARLLSHGERDDLHGGDHLARDHRLIGRKRRERDRLVDLVEAVDRTLIHDQHASGLGEEIRAPGEGSFDVHSLPCHRRRDLGRGCVLRDIPRLGARYYDHFDAGGLERGDLVLADQRALFQHEAALADRMHRNATLRLRHWHRAELHEPFSGDWRSSAVISPMMATAISEGDTAPIASPIGAWLMCTARVMTSCGGGTCTVKKALPAGISTMTLLPRRICFSISSLSGSRATSAALTRRCLPVATSVTTTAARRAARSAFRVL